MRQLLDAIGQKLGLTFVLKDDYVVELRPVPALARSGPAATTQELGVLDMLASTPLGSVGEHIKVPATLLEAIDQKLVEKPNPISRSKIALGGAA